MQDFLLRERQGVISERLRLNGRVLAAELALEFGVSEDTVRRDLREMAAAGLCERVYGGALPVSPAHGNLTQRMGFAADRKQALARAAAQQIAAGSCVFFDAGSTNLALARALPAGTNLTVATNAPAIAAALLERDIATIQLGGLIDPRVGGAIGAKAMRDAEAFRPDILVLGVCGIAALAYFLHSINVLTERGQAAYGIAVIIGIIAMCSANLNAVNWRTIIWGFALQLGLALFVLKFRIYGLGAIGIPDGYAPGQELFGWLGGLIAMWGAFAAPRARFLLPTAAVVAHGDSPIDRENATADPKRRSSPPTYAPRKTAGRSRPLSREMSANASSDAMSPVCVASSARSRGNRSGFAANATAGR